MMPRAWFLKTVVLLTGICLSLSACESLGQTRVAIREERLPDREKSIRAFATVASVLLSPRCLNCHVRGDSPLQGDAETPHPMNVKRGPDGRGQAAMRCTNCHQAENSSEPHGPRGREGWRLPPPTMRLAWQGLSIGELCQSIKDPRTNGNRTLAELLEHVRDDPFVNWGWNPGAGRTTPPVSHEEFVTAVVLWAESGASCPQPATEPR